ncbi:CRISPR-associated helicase/endonuclease Cas3 [Caldalkalibacillus thermarum]|uniref:CRISPR-associated helicase Cas3' n=1 Tax=Caldalkalibacillus thermarum TaxID=296745 RepID=UPI00166E0DA3|nr:CRISPR-associated helicase Cas3' [Caldalkalibacillus thermarum]GGK34735.1 CRISPR-associated helicase/endonuclease Cas3 [Caldalkalibacillus thermarum]
MKKFHAHTPSEEGRQWHDLNEHLLNVARLARDFAVPFHGEEVAYLCGLLHDLGKFHHLFQEYLKKQAKGENGKSVPHAIWGAAVVYQIYWRKMRHPELWMLFALPIAGHHSGLHSSASLSLTLEERIEKQQSYFLEILQNAEPFLREVVFPHMQKEWKMPSLTETEREMWIRMVFSALVDADYLDTEQHFQPTLAQVRRREISVEDLWNRLASDQQQLIDKADNTLVNRVRRQVYEACVQSAARPQGVFRLTVPTGGGKTRSGLAFALKHAAEHQLDRVIVAIPYTSIIEQTAGVYREIFGDEAVLEHHSQVEVDDEEAQKEHLIRQRLSTENWDAPLIVTTTVQLFDSLFSNRPGKVRKLHNLSRSVIILDEVQTLPTELLRPTLDALAMLVKHCQSTVVLSTATQPVFEESRFLKAFSGLAVEEILSPALVDNHFRQLQRVNYEVWKQPVLLGELVDFIREQRQVLVVFNTRKEAQECVHLLREDGDILHLSTLLCGAHRRKILDEVRLRLTKNLPVRLISTQVVEAGVDLDFPLVMRQIGPLDRIVQAAGRCNREGKLNRGRVIIFETQEGGSPRGPYRVAMEVARAMLSRIQSEDLHRPDIFRNYFQQLFASVDLDHKTIQDDREALAYPHVAEKYRLVDQDTVPVVVPYEDSQVYLRTWEEEPSRKNFRRLQPYIIQLYQWEVQKKEQEGWMRLVSGNLYQWLGGYDELIGMTEEFHDPYDLIG